MERAARLIKKNKLSNEIFTDEDFNRALWPAAVGKGIAAHTSRIKLVRSTLVVEVEDAVWRKQLVPLTSQIVGRIQKVTGNDTVRDVEFRIGVPRRQPVRAMTREGQGQPQNQQVDEAEDIRDPVLKKVYRLSRKKATA
jgi:predicted nucleic acid-binding Zn ribbon protein